jgi:NADPH2:quinone reductase
VTAVGSGVSDVHVGDRVAYVSDGNGSDSNARGGYAEARNIAAHLVVPVPSDISSTTAAAIMLKGLTVEALLHRVVEVRRGDTILVHAAAGGVGSILVPWAKQIGATVIGVVSTDAKAEVARANGCDHVIVSSREDFADRARTLTSQQGVRVVYDSIGRDTFERSLASLANRGWLVLFGQASGPVPPFEPARLGKGSYFLTRPLLFHYISTRAERLAAAEALFARVRNGSLKLAPPKAFPLRDAAEAHRVLQQRQTTGSLVLVP